MKFHFLQAVRALILFAFSAMLFKMHFSGDLTKFINPKYEALSQTASVLFLILFFIQITRVWTVKENSQHHCHPEEYDCSHHHDHGDSSFNIKKLISYLVIVFPLITGFLLPANVLDSSIAAKKGGVAVLSNKNQTPQEDKELTNTEPNDNNNNNNNNNIIVPEEKPLNENPVDPGLIKNQTEISKEEYDQLIQQLDHIPNIKMDDYVFDSYYEEISKDISKFKGRKIELKGFVYKEEGFEQDQLVISRFLITHCVADASLIGFLSEFSEASSLEGDTWIEANGILDVTTYNGIELPIIKITDWKKISQPNEPYLYPITVKIL